MKIEDIMTRRVVAARADTDLSHVAQLMWENDCGSIPVVDAEDRVVGILTDRDTCMSAHFNGRALRELRAGGCMATEVVTCRPSDAVGSVAKVMGTRRVRRVPITDEAGRLLGLVSIGDLARAAASAGGRDKKALESAVSQALGAICARENRDEVAPALPMKRPARAAKPVSKKRAKV